MGRRILAKAEAEEENVFWVTMTDLLLGLTMVFMTLFVLTMTGFTQEKVKQQEAQTKVAEELIENLKKKQIEVEIDKVTGQVKISDLELFELNSYTLSEKGKKYLDKFVPIYIDTIYSDAEISDKISNLLVQGHTDSQTFKGVPSKEEQFVKNMELSLKRANAVEEYMFKTKYDKQYTDKLVKTLVVEGKSYTEPVMVNGKEDYKKSRRVELEFVVKASGIQDFLVPNWGKPKIKEVTEF